MESACVLREGLMYNISQTKQSNLLLHFLRTLKRRSVFVLLLPCCVSRCFFHWKLYPLDPQIYHVLFQILYIRFFFPYCVSYLGNYTHRTRKYFMYCFKFYIFVLHLKQKVRKFLAVSFEKTWPLKTEGSTLPKSKSKQKTTLVNCMAQHFSSEVRAAVLYKTV